MNRARIYVSLTFLKAGQTSPSARSDRQPASLPHVFENMERRQELFYRDNLDADS